MKLEYSGQIFEKCPYCKFNENPSSGGRVFPCVRTDGQTDITNLMVTFENLRTLLKKVYPVLTSQVVCPPKCSVHSFIPATYPASLIVMYCTFLSNPHETIKSSSCLYSILTCFLTSFLLGTYSHSWQANISQRIKKYSSLHGALVYKSGNVYLVLSSCLLLRYLLCTQMPL
jgi:hypothetical protein